jgi:hypothetical protein
MPIPSPTKDRTIISLSQKRIVAALFLVAIISMQAFSVFVLNALGTLHKKQLQALSNIQAEATAAHLTLENILGGNRAEDPGVVEKQPDRAIEQARLLTISGEEHPLTRHHGSAEVAKAQREIGAQLDSLRLLGRQRLLAPASREIRVSLASRYDNAFSLLIDTTKAMENIFWQCREQNRAFLQEVQIGMIRQRGLGPACRPGIPPLRHGA